MFVSACLCPLEKMSMILPRPVVHRHHLLWGRRGVTWLLEQNLPLLGRYLPNKKCVLEALEL